MKSFQYTVKDPVGIHARPAGILAKKAKEYNCEITVQKGEKTALATRLMAVMGLCVKCGDTLTVTVSGEGEETVVTELARFFEENF